MNEPRRMTVPEAVALAVCYGGCSEAWPADHIADEVWDSLHARGLLAVSRDFTGEGTTITTQAGQMALALALTRVERAFPDEQAIERAAFWLFARSFVPRSADHEALRPLWLRMNDEDRDFWFGEGRAVLVAALEQPESPDQGSTASIGDPHAQVSPEAQ